MDKFESIRVFSKVVETGGFAAAGRTLGLSRSVVNRAVLNLEQELGTQLLRRSTRQVSPTETGILFYDRCAQVLADFDEVIAVVTEMQERPTGKLRINAPMSFGILHLSRLVATYMTTYPDAQVELVLNDRAVDPIEEGFDITVRIGQPMPSTSLITRTIAPIKRVICASPEYLRHAGEPRRLSELKQHRCLHYGYQASGNHWRIVAADGEQSVPINCVMWSNNGEVLKDAAINHQGITLLPTFMISDALQQGLLRTILIDYEPLSATLCALYPRHRHLSAKVCYFIELLVKQYGDRPQWDLVP